MYFPSTYTSAHGSTRIFRNPGGFGGGGAAAITGGGAPICEACTNATASAIAPRIAPCTDASRFIPAHPSGPGNDGVL